MLMPMIFTIATAMAALLPNMAPTQARIWSLRLDASAMMFSSILRSSPRLS